MSFRYHHIALFIVCLLSYGLKAQSFDPKLKALNNYINYSNESVHGLLIIHRLLENFNQDINKYVDLEAFQINFYSNKDLPKNIFVDQEHWFYETTPYEWFEKAKLESNVFTGVEKKKLNQSIDNLKAICNLLNASRFEVETFINENDLSETHNQEQVYEMLENCVKWYDDFYKEQRILIANVHKIYHSYFGKSNSEYSDIYGRMFYIQKYSENIFFALRAKKMEGVDQYIEELQKHSRNFESLIKFRSNNFVLKGKQFKSLKSRIEEKVKSLIERSHFFYNDGSVPKEYKLYGKFYYFHNSDLINKFNRYGNGFVSDMNTIIKITSMPAVIFAEMPHYYQVIYPEKLEKEDHIVSSDPDIEILPKKLRDRNIITNTRKITVDSIHLVIEIFDHKIQDGDIISLNFNGDWILEKQSIQTKPMSIKLKLNETGKNYLLLHAENLGRQPPNTLGISYYYKGLKKLIILESDLNASEMIEIEIEGN